MNKNGGETNVSCIYDIEGGGSDKNDPIWAAASMPCIVQCKKPLVIVVLNSIGNSRRSSTVVVVNVKTPSLDTLDSVV